MRLDRVMFQCESKWMTPTNISIFGDSVIGETNHDQTATALIACRTTDTIASTVAAYGGLTGAFFHSLWRRFKRCTGLSRVNEEPPYLSPSDHFGLVTDFEIS